MGLVFVFGRRSGYGEVYCRGGRRVCGFFGGVDSGLASFLRTLFRVEDFGLE